MKKKLLAVLSLVMVLAMESVTVFATEATVGGSGSPSTGNVLYGNAGDDTITAEVAAVTLDNMSVEELSNTVEITIDEASGTVASDTGLEFKKDEDAGLQLTQTKQGVTPLPNITIKVNKEQGHTTKALTTAETKVSVAITQYASDLGEKVGANVQTSYAVSVEGSVDESGKPDKPVEFSVSGANIVNGNITIIHSTDDGRTENLGAEYKNGKITSKKIPSSYSPFVLLVFDSPVPGLTTDIDYSTQATSLTTGESNTISGDATSPKTADAYPYAATVAVVAIACVFACSKKIARR
jgi:hypothetical protein